MGTNENANRLVVVEKPQPKKKAAENPKYEKAVWVSRLAKSVTEEDIRDHITKSTMASSNFTVHRLVKKDRDESALNFVSFKISVNLPDFEILNDPNVWPKNVMVREFVEIKPATFGDFLHPILNEQNSRKTPEKMDQTNPAPLTPLMNGQDAS